MKLLTTLIKIMYIMAIISVEEILVGEVSFAVIATIIIQDCKIKILIGLEILLLLEENMWLEEEEEEDGQDETPLMNMGDQVNVQSVVV